MSTTAISRAISLGNKAREFECVSRLSPNAQYTAMADGIVNVNTYNVAKRKTFLNLVGLYMACIISLPCIHFKHFRNHVENTLVSLPDQQEKQKKKT